MEDVSFRVEATPIPLLEWIHANEKGWRKVTPLPGEGHQKSRIEAEIGKARLWASRKSGPARGLIRVFSYWPEKLFTDGDGLERQLEELATRLC
jgi:hypothetical protein